MNTDSFKIINENDEENIAKIITAFTYKDKEYIIYSIDTDTDNSNIYVSKLIKDNDGNDTICDIENEQEREEVFRATEEILNKIANY